MRILSGSDIVLRSITALLLTLSENGVALEAEFSRCGPEPIYSGSHVPPILDTKEKRRFRTALRDGSKESAN